MVDSLTGYLVMPGRKRGLCFVVGHSVVLYLGKDTEKPAENKGIPFHFFFFMGKMSVIVIKMRHEKRFICLSGQYLPFTGGGRHHETFGGNPRFGA